jgi:hypothetical protein
MHFQIWAGDTAIGEPLPLPDALDHFREQVELDGDDGPPLFLLPPGYQPPDPPCVW